MLKFLHLKKVRTLFLLTSCWILPATFFGQGVSLVQPANNIFVSDTNVNFEWNYNAAAVRYHFQLSQDAGFSLIVDSSSFVYVTTRTFSVPQVFQTYYWRVRYYDGSTYSAWSSTRNFTFFIPLEISGLKLWVRSDSGIVQNLGIVSQWNDISGSNNVFQIDTASQPAFINNAINNLPTLRLSTNDFLTTANIDLGVRSEFMLIKKNDFPTGNYHPIIANFNPPFYQLYVPGSNAFNTYHSSTNFDHSISFDFCYQFFGRIISSDSINFYKNGVAGISGSDSFLNTNQPLLIGNYGTNFLNGDISEIIIYDYALPDSGRTLVENYLNDRYAPPVNLGPDVTVCAFPVTLHAGSNACTNYLWSDASTDDSLQVSAPGDYYVTVTNIFGITTNDTISVFLDNSNFTVNLPSDTNICFGTPMILVAGPPHLPYLWSTGSTDNYISIATSGIYFVSVTDCNGDTTSDTINVTVFPIPVFNFGNDTISCFNQSLILDPQLGNSLTYLWSDNSTDTVLTVNATGNHFLYVQDTIGCFYSDTIFIQVDSTLATIWLGADDTLCEGNFIALVSGASPGLTYLWSDNSTNAFLTINTSGTYTVTVTNSNNCTATDDKTVTIIGVAPVASFTVTDICENDSTHFTDASSPPDSIVAWFWNFGEPLSTTADTSSAQDPAHLYAGIGTYIVTLRVTAPSGCYQDFTDTISIYPKPIPNFSVNSISCSGVPIAFTDSTDSLGFPIQSWAWNFGDPGSGGNNISSQINPSHIFSTPGNYNVTLTVTNIHGCDSTISLPVTVHASAFPAFSHDTNCYGEPMVFSNLTFGSYQTIYWDFGDASGTSATANTIYHTYANPGNYTVTLSTSTQEGCISSYTMVVTVNSLPHANFLTTPACVNTLYSFTDSSWVNPGTVNRWKWTLPDGSTDTTNSPDYIFTDSLIYSVKLLAISQSGCKDSITKNIKVYPQPVASFGYDFPYGDAPLTETFGNTSTGAISYLWDFGDGSPTSTDTNPEHTYYNLGNYTVTLIATSSRGCMDTTVRYVYVLKPILDLAVTSVNKTNGINYISVSATLQNLGNLEITNFKIAATLENRLPVFENWNGNLTTINPIMNYNFTAQFEISNNNPPTYLCVEATYPNNVWDDNPANNILCINLSEDFVIVDPFPNPSTDLINFLIIAPHKDRLQIDVFDAAGKLISHVYNGTVVTGLNKFTFDTSSLSQGVYFCRFSFLTKTFVRPLTHISKNK